MNVFGYNNPYYEYEFLPSILQDHPEALASMESKVPGVQVNVVVSGFPQRILKALDVPYSAQGKPSEWKFYFNSPSLHNRITGIIQYTNQVNIIVPAHAGVLADDLLVEMGLLDGDTNYLIKAGYVGDGLINSRADGSFEELCEAFHDISELKPNVLESLRTFQPSAIFHASVNPYMKIVWACGAGKTRGAFLSALTRPGPVLIICPARAMGAWLREIHKVSKLKPFLLLPKSRLRKKHQSYDDYLKECKKNNQRPVVICGLESCTILKDPCLRLNYAVLIFDEIHQMSDYKRWEAGTDSDGNTRISKRLTTASKELTVEESIGLNNKEASSSEKVTRAVTLMELSQHVSLSLSIDVDSTYDPRRSYESRRPLRIGLTATPLGDGRHRRLWAPLDLLDPGGFGSFRNFAAHYCINFQNPVNTYTQYPNDNGSSYPEEIRERASYLLHEVTYSETHKSLPPITVEFKYLAVEDQNKPDAFKQKIRSAEKLLATSKSQEEVQSAKRNLTWLKLAEASTRCRDYVISETLECLKQNGHVCVFTGLVDDTVKWVEELTSELKKLASEHEWAINTRIYWGHGTHAAIRYLDGAEELVIGHDALSRQELAEDHYGPYDGPAIFIGTGDAFGESINGLEHTDRAFFAMLPFSSADVIQWRGRFDRGGRPTLLTIVIPLSTYAEVVAFYVQEKLGAVTKFTVSEEGRQLLLALEHQDVAAIDAKFNSMFDNMMEEGYYDD